MIVFSLDTTRGYIEGWLGRIEEDPKKPRDILSFKVETLAGQATKSPNYSVHTEEKISGVVSEILTQGEVKIPELVVINLGPGSFTSTRVGLAFLKGWFQGSKTKFHTVGLSRHQIKGYVPTMLPKGSKVVIIDDNIIRAYINALIGYKKFLEGKRDDPLMLKPIYGNHKQ